MKITKNILKEMIQQEINNIVEDNGDGAGESLATSQELKQKFVDLVATIRQGGLGKIQKAEIPAVEEAINIIQGAISGNIGVAAVITPLTRVAQGLKQIKRHQLEN